MTPIQMLQIAVGGVAIVCGGLSFVVYMILSFRRPAAQEAVNNARQTTDLMLERETAVTPAEVTELVKALASLGESLAKAGPALWSMIGSALFLLIAAISAGVLQGKPEAAPQPQGGGAPPVSRPPGGRPRTPAALRTRRPPRSPGRNSP